MNKRRALLAATAISAACPRLALASDAEGLRIGLTAVILADQAAFLSRWGRYLAARTGTPVTFISRESYQEILDMLFAGKLNAAWICGYPYVLHEPLLRLMAVPLYQGQPTYQSYLIRTAGTKPQIDGWKDLKGKVLAYSDPLSNSGWLVPQGQLLAHGLRPADFKRTFFAHGHRNVAEAVAARLADAGAIDGYVWETMKKQRMPAIERTEIAWKSDFYGFPPMVTRTDEEHPQAAALRAGLLDMGNDPEGRSLLADLNLDGFTGGERAMFEGIGKLARLVNGAAGTR